MALAVRARLYVLAPIWEHNLYPRFNRAVIEHHGMNLSGERNGEALLALVAKSKTYVANPLRCEENTLPET